MIAGWASIFFFSIEEALPTLSDVRDFRAYYSKKGMLAATRDSRTGVFLKFERQRMYIETGTKDMIYILLIFQETKEGVKLKFPSVCIQYIYSIRIK